MPDGAAVGQGVVGRRHLWLPCAIIFLGAGLRLSQLNWAQYRRDDAIVLGLAQAALTTHHIPWVGMISTLGIDNGPAQVWLVMLGILAGPSPFAAEWAIALLNVVGIAACFAFGRAAFGRRVGLTAALLLAVSSWSVLYSRRLWGNDMTAPFAALGLWSLACVIRRGDRVHQVLIFVWAALLAQVYVVALAELPALLLGLVAAAVLRRLRPGPTLLGIGLFLALTGPYALQTVLPELGSLHRLTGGQHPVTDATSLRYLAETVGLDAYQADLPHLADILDATSRPAVWISALAAFALVAGAALAGRTLLRGNSAEERALCAVVLAWAFLPVVATVRHGVGIFPHYELGAVPATYVLMAIALARLRGRARWAWPGGLALGTIVGGQLVVATIFLAHVPNYEQGTAYGVPLADVATLGRAAQQTLTRQGVSNLLVVGHYDGSEMGQALRTWVPNVAIVDDQGSLHIPRGDQTLVLLTTRDDSALVTFLRHTAPSRDYRFPGDHVVFRLFVVTTEQLRAAAARQITATAPATLGGAVTLQGSTLTPAAAPGGSILWSARWVVTAAGAREKPVASIFMHLVTAKGAKVAAHDEALDNQAALWRTGDEILTWVNVPVATDVATGTDQAVGGLYRLGSGDSIEPLAGPDGPQMNLGTVRVVAP